MKWLGNKYEKFPFLPKISFDDTPSLSHWLNSNRDSIHGIVRICRGGVVVDGWEHPMTNAFVLINGVGPYLLIFQIGAIIPTLRRPLTHSRVFLFPSAHCVCARKSSHFCRCSQRQRVYSPFSFIHYFCCFFFLCCPFGNILLSRRSFK